MKVLIYVHGGVSGLVKPSLPALDYAVRAGLDAVGALDAVEAAVRSMENDPRLNAGVGSVLNRDGRLELDAGVAVTGVRPDNVTNSGLSAAVGRPRPDDEEQRCAGVANVRVAHPISLARKVMEETPHVLLTGEGAVQAAQSLHMEPLRDATPEQRARYERARAEGKLEVGDFGAPEHVDTVGAVALDEDGRLSAGSSTGGVFGKLPGRVGDAPVFGAGFYASAACAVVGTGIGEVFMRTLASFRVAQLITSGQEPQAACEAVIAEIRAREGSAAAGLLAVDTNGKVGAAYQGGSWAVEGPGGPVRPVQVQTTA